MWVKTSSNELINLAQCAKVRVLTYDKESFLVATKWHGGNLETAYQEFTLCNGSKEHCSKQLAKIEIAIEDNKPIVAVVDDEPDNYPEGLDSDLATRLTILMKKRQI